MELRDILAIAQAAHEHHVAHHRLDVSVVQQTDDLGIALYVDLHAALPAGALLFARLKGAWLGRLSAVDGTLFRDADANFLTLGPISGQRGSLYIPYGAAKNRGPGIYTLDMSVQLVKTAGSGLTEIGQASYKVVLPEQPAWRRVEFFAPLIKLCMAVIRVDNEVLPSEIRGLKNMFSGRLELDPNDLAALRAMMKDPAIPDLGQALRSLALRMPMFTPEDTITTLARVARLDAPVNSHELAVLTHIASLLGIQPARCRALLSPSTTLPVPLRELP
jgi:uncharacterized tellurite resistance protein B-like protein